MHFLKEIRHHLKEFESEASDEIHKFIDFLHSKYEPIGPAVVAPPAPIGQPDASTFTAPVVNPTPAVEVASTDASVTVAIATTEVQALTTTDIATLSTTAPATLSTTEAN